MSATKKDKFILYQIFTRLFGNTKTTNKFYGTIEENGCGKFNDINENALLAIKDLGVTHVWYTGVIEHATLTDYSSYGVSIDHPLIVKGRAGSPYAVKDYYDVDPDLAVNVADRMAEFETLVKRTHDHELKVIIDFIPNHVARQYNSDVRPSHVPDFGQDDDTSLSFSPQNNFYYIPHQDFIVPAGHTPPVTVESPYLERPAKATGNDVFQAQPSQYDWYETIKLNYGVDYLNGRATYFDPIPSTWLKMYDILAFWTGKGVDGFRCDMAEMVPVEFWGWVIPKIKALNPDIIFIAEIYNSGAYHNYIYNGKFDYLYDKVGLYNSLEKLIKGHGSAEDFTRLWQQETGDIEPNMLRFLENHDEQRLASRFFAGDPWLAVPAITLCATLNTGPFMLYFGQELGAKPTESEGFQGDDGRTTIFDYWSLPEIQEWIGDGSYDGKNFSNDRKALRSFYQRLNQFITSNEAISEGAFYDLQYVNIDGQSHNYDKTRIYSFLRYTPNQRFLLVYNFDQNNTYETNVKMPEEVWAQTLGLKRSTTYILKPVFPLLTPLPHLEAAAITSSGVQVTLPPVSVCIYEIVAKEI